mgnify:CR=1 FL=1
MNQPKNQPKVSHDCPQGVEPGKMFVDPADGKTYCCEKCPKIGQADNKCEFC